MVTTLGSACLAMGAKLAGAEEPVRSGSSAPADETAYGKPFATPGGALGAVELVGCG
jgi:hypothetical protein